MLVARIGPFDREAARIHLIHDVQNLSQGHVVVVRTGVVAPADVDADPLGIDALQRVIEDLDVELDLGPKLRDRCVGKLQVTTEGKIGTVDLEDETAANDRPVLLAQGIGKRIQEVPAAVVVRGAHEHGDTAWRHRRQESLRDRLVLDFGRQGVQVRGKLVPSDVGDRTVVGWHRRPRQLFAVGDEEALRHLREVEQVTRRKWAGCGLPLEAAETVFHIVGEPGLAHLAIADDVDPGRDLPLHGLVHGGPHALAQVFALCKLILLNRGAPRRGRAAGADSRCGW